MLVWMQCLSERVEGAGVEETEHPLQILPEMVALEHWEVPVQLF